jgi:hypothetical protein
VDPQVIYDPQLETAALIDMDSMRGMGPIMAGPNAQKELQAFVRAMVPTVYELNSYELVRCFGEWWEREFAALYETPDEAVADTAQPGADTAPHEKSLADHEQQYTPDGPPEPAAHDTDMEAARRIR